MNMAGVSRLDGSSLGIRPPSRLQIAIVYHSSVLGVRSGTKTSGNGRGILGRQGVSCLPNLPN